MANEQIKSVDYATPVRPLTGAAQHAVWAGETPADQIRAASFAWHRQQGKTATDALAAMRADVAAGKLRFPAHYPDANADFAAHGESRVRFIENPAALGLRLVGLAHDAAPAGHAYLRAAVDHTGWHLDPDGCGETVAGVVYRTSGKDGRARYLVGYADPWNADKDGNGPALLSLSPLIGDRLDSDWDQDSVLRDAARRADSIAERMADDERNYQDANRAGREAREKAVEMRETARGYVQAVRALRAALKGRHAIDGGRAVAAALVVAVRDHCDSLKAARAAFHSVVPSPSWQSDAWRDGYAEGGL